MAGSGKLAIIYCVPPVSELVIGRLKCIRDNKCMVIDHMIVFSNNLRESNKEKRILILLTRFVVC